MIYWTASNTFDEIPFPELRVGLLKSIDGKKNNNRDWFILTLTPNKLSERLLNTTYVGGCRFLLTDAVKPENDKWIFFLNKEYENISSLSEDGILLIQNLSVINIDFMDNISMSFFRQIIAKIEIFE